jgi:hypothetical protein
VRESQPAEASHGAPPSGAVPSSVPSPSSSQPSAGPSSGVGDEATNEATFDTSTKLTALQDLRKTTSLDPPDEPKPPSSGEPLPSSLDPSAKAPFCVDLAALLTRDSPALGAPFPRDPDDSDYDTTEAARAPLLATLGLGDDESEDTIRHKVSGDPLAGLPPSSGSRPGLDAEIPAPGVPPMRYPAPRADEDDEQTLLHPSTLGRQAAAQEPSTVDLPPGIDPFAQTVDFVQLGIAQPEGAADITSSLPPTGLPPLSAPFSSPDSGAPHSPQSALPYRPPLTSDLAERELAVRAALAAATSVSEDEAGRNARRDRAASIGALTCMGMGMLVACVAALLATKSSESAGGYIGATIPATLSMFLAGVATMQRQLHVKVTMVGMSALLVLVALITLLVA